MNETPSNKWEIRSIINSKPAIYNTPELEHRRIERTFNKISRRILQIAYPDPHISNAYIEIDPEDIIVIEEPIITPDDTDTADYDDYDDEIYTNLLLLGITGADDEQNNFIGHHPNLSEIGRMLVHFTRYKLREDLNDETQIINEFYFYYKSGGLYVELINTTHFVGHNQKIITRFNAKIPHDLVDNVVSYIHQIYPEESSVVDHANLLKASSQQKPKIVIDTGDELFVSNIYPFQGYQLFDYQYAILELLRLSLDVMKDSTDMSYVISLYKPMKSNKPTMLYDSRRKEILFPPNLQPLSQNFRRLVSTRHNLEYVLRNIQSA